MALSSTACGAAPERMAPAGALLIAFGNADRQDDGAGWAILSRVAQRLGLPFPREPEDEQPEPGMPLGLLYTLQLAPELAELAARYPRVLFIDAHTGALPADLNWQALQPVFQRSPLTHHMTAESVVALAHSAYGASPQAALVSVRGQAFGFERGLTPFTSALADQAVERILEWLGDE